MKERDTLEKAQQYAMIPEPVSLLGDKYGRQYSGIGRILKRNGFNLIKKTFRDERVFVKTLIEFLVNKENLSSIQ